MYQTSFRNQTRKLFRGDLKKNEAFKKEVSHYEKQSNIKKKLFAVQIKKRKVAAKLQNLLPSARSLYPMKGSLYNAIFYRHANIYLDIKFYNLAHCIRAYKTLPTPALGLWYCTSLTHKTAR